MDVVWFCLIFCILIVDHNYCIMLFGFKDDSVVPCVDSSRRYAPCFRQEVVRYAEQHSVRAAEVKYTVGQSSVRKWIKDQKFCLPVIMSEIIVFLSQTLNNTIYCLLTY